MNPPAGTSPRSTAAERRDEVLEAAVREFATRGYEGGSTERVAKAAGISQPYVFRLFGSKRDLFLAVVDRCYEETLEMFREAAGGRTGEEALDAIGLAYVEAITSRPERLQLQLAAYAACDEEAVRERVRLGYGHLVDFVRGIAGGDAEVTAQFFAKGMLLNVVTAMQLPASTLPWGDFLMAGCIGESNPEKAALLRGKAP